MPMKKRMTKGTEMRRRTHATTLLCLGLAGALAISGCGEKDPGGTGGTGGTTTGGSGGRGGSAGSGGSSSGGAGGTSSTGGQTGDAGGGGDTAPVSGDYFPFAVGNSWEYEVTSTGSPTEKKIH